MKYKKDQKVLIVKNKGAKEFNEYIGTVAKIIDVFEEAYLLDIRDGTTWDDEEVELFTEISFTDEEIRKATIEISNKGIDLEKFINETIELFKKNYDYLKSIATYIEKLNNKNDQEDIEILDIKVSNNEKKSNEQVFNLKPKEIWVQFTDGIMEKIYPQDK